LTKSVNWRWEVFGIENFEKLPLEKRLNVLNAGFSCFGKNGYKKTSIADIAAAAGISKASMFHYFNTKKELYLYLYRYSCDEILAAFKTGTEDFFECILLGTQIKMRVLEKYPGMLDFLITLFTEEDNHFFAGFREVNTAEVKKGTEMFFYNVDWNRFKPDIDRSTAMNLVNWTTDGYIRSVTTTRSKEEMVEDMDRYLKILKRAMYKEEYL
jgi:AcrR family transcriptional regulator